MHCEVRLELLEPEGKGTRYVAIDAARRRGGGTVTDQLVALMKQ